MLVITIAILIALIFLIVSIANFDKALIFALFILITFPVQTSIEISSSLPIINIHRGLLILLFLVVMFRTSLNFRSRSGIHINEIALWRFIALWLGTTLIATCFSLRFFDSLKIFLSLIFEGILFFLLIVFSIKDKKDVERIVFVIGLAALLVSLLGILQARTGGWSITNYLPPPPREILDYQMAIEPEAGGRGMRPLSTLPHPLLLGTFLALCWPFALLLVSHEQNILRKVIGWCTIFSILICQYYTVSRGPWLGLLMIFSILFLFGSKKIRKTVLLVLIIIALTLLIKPGVINYVYNIYNSTVSENANDPLASNFEYRFELYRVSLNSILSSPLRILFGFGPGTFRSLNLKGKVFGAEVDFWSADSNYAASMVETGFMGFAAFVILLLGILSLAWKGCSKLHPSRDIMLCSFASLFAYCFIMSNAPVFGYQIFFLFWIILSIITFLNFEAQKELHNQKMQS